MAKSRTIVIIESDIFLNRLYQNKFSSAGWTVTLAADGSSGLKKVQQIKPDVILLDLDMLPEGGWEVLGSLKSNQDGGDRPVVVLTNLSRREDIKKAKSLGAAEFLIKAHFLPSEVVAAVARQLPNN